MPRPPQSRVPSHDSGLRVGVPWRSAREEKAGKQEKIEPYLRAVEEAGGKAVPISLGLPPEELKRLAASCDAFVLPGSPADVDPSRYEVPRGPKTADPDPQRERTDWALLDDAFAEHKPVLAICYGVQLLNVYRGGALVQDIATELGTNLQHEWSGPKQAATEPHHPARLEDGSRLARLAGQTQVSVNSSHHQSIREPGKGLRIVAHAPDGVVEAVEWAGDDNWVTGVQWHPERMSTDPLARSLFRQLVDEARAAREKAAVRRG